MYLTTIRHDLFWHAVGDPSTQFDTNQICKGFKMIYVPMTQCPLIINSLSKKWDLEF